MLCGLRPECEKHINCVFLLINCWVSSQNLILSVDQGELFRDKAICQYSGSYNWCETPTQDGTLSNHIPCQTGRVHTPRYVYCFFLVPFFATGFI